MVFSEYSHTRSEGIILLKREFFSLQDKESAWLDLHELVRSQDANVRTEVAKAIGFVFSNIPDKELAWQDLQELACDDNEIVRLSSAIAIGSGFEYLPDKNQAWFSLVKLSRDNKSNVKRASFDSIKAISPYLSGMKLEWQDLPEIFAEKNYRVRRSAATAFGLTYPYLLDKILAWNTLIKLVRDSNSSVRWTAVESVSSIFPQVDDINLAWEYLHELALDRNEPVRRIAAKLLGSVFYHIPNKEQAWKNLHDLSMDEDDQVRFIAARAIGSAFPNLPDKELAWQDLIRLAGDEDRDVRWAVAKAIEIAFPFLPDTNLAWKKLHKLVWDPESALGMGRAAAEAIGSAFPYLPEKELAWQDLRRLSSSGEEMTAVAAAKAIGYAFPNIPDKKTAWQHLLKLTKDLRPGVRCFSNHALGRVSIFKATEAEDSAEFRARLEDSIYYFEKSFEEGNIQNPAAFCLPFYRSLHGLLFTEASNEVELSKYIDQARRTVEDSKSRETLLEAIENLSLALLEVKSCTLDDITSHKRDLKAYTRYCFQAAECLEEMKDRTPLATKVMDVVMIKKSMPILNEKIKALFKAVEEATKNLCKNSIGTEFEELGASAYQTTKGLGKVDSPIAAERYFENIVPVLYAHCEMIPPKAKDYFKNLINCMETASLEKRFEILKSVLEGILMQKADGCQRAKENEELVGLLRDIEFGIMNLSKSSGNIKHDLFELQIDIKKLCTKTETNSQSSEYMLSQLMETDQANVNRLEKIKDNLADVFEAISQSLPGGDDAENMNIEVQRMRQSNAREGLAIAADIIQVFGPMISSCLPIITKLMAYSSQ